MKIFKQKEYTIQEGHYTGPKDMDKLPSTLSVLGKTTLGGSAVGGAIGGILKETGINDETGILDGAKKGGKIGFLGGVLTKILLNNLHKPMKTIKYQEVDKLIRREFGIHRISGFTFGDTLEKRRTVDDKFGFNDRNVTNYKISFVISKNRVTMYTLGLTEDELTRLSSSLDYYCKKYFGMEYTSRVINSKTCSYSVNIVFTNYSAISSFILEVSELLGHKINILDNDILLTRLEEDMKEKEFSITSRIKRYLSNAELDTFLIKGGLMFMKNADSSAEDIIDDISMTYANKAMSPSTRKDYNQSYLLKVLKENGFYEGVHYTFDIPGSKANIMLLAGDLFITTNKGTKEDGILERLLKNDGFVKTEVSKKVIVRTYKMETKQKFIMIIKKIIHSGIKPNIFRG